MSAPVSAGSQDPSEVYLIPHTLSAAPLPALPLPLLSSGILLTYLYHIQKAWKYTLIYSKNH